MFDGYIENGLLYMKISLITVTYNSADTLSDTIQSVLSQSYKDIEYIIIDGLSNDGTMSIIKKYEPQFHGCMRWVSEPDKGIYDAMNKGIRKATGDVIGILNSDDFYTSNDVLKRIAFELQQPDIDAVYGDVHYVKYNDLNKCVRYYSSRLFQPCWMRLGFMPAHPSFYCRREVYETYGAFDTSYRIAADFENLLRLIFIRHIHIKYVQMDFVTMRTGGASSSGVQSHKLIMREHLRALRTNKVYSNIFLLALRYVYKLLEVGLTVIRSVGYSREYVKNS